MKIINDKPLHSPQELLKTHITFIEILLDNEPLTEKERKQLQELEVSYNESLEVLRNLNIGS